MNNLALPCENQNEKDKQMDQKPIYECPERAFSSITHPLFCLKMALFLTKIVKGIEGVNGNIFLNVRKIRRTKIFPIKV